MRFILRIKVRNIVEVAIYPTPSCFCLFLWWTQ